jgi:hypothetical protein
VDQGRTRARSARVRADPSLPQIWAADGCVLPPDTFGSARWALFFQPLCPVGQKRTRGVRLGRPAGDALSSSSRSTALAAGESIDGIILQALYDTQVSSEQPLPLLPLFQASGVMDA